MSACWLAPTGSRAGMIGPGRVLNSRRRTAKPERAWCSPEVIERYYSMKTGVLFAADRRSRSAGSGLAEGGDLERAQGTCSAAATSLPTI